MHGLLQVAHGIGRTLESSEDLQRRALRGDGVPRQATAERGAVGLSALLPSRRAEDCVRYGVRPEYRTARGDCKTSSREIRACLLTRHLSTRWVGRSRRPERVSQAAAAAEGVEALHDTLRLQNRTWEMNDAWSCRDKLHLKQESEDAALAADAPS